MTIDDLICPDRPGWKFPRLVATYYSMLAFLAMTGLTTCPEGGILRFRFSGVADDDGWRYFGPRGAPRRIWMAVKRIPEFITYSLRGARCVVHYHGRGYL